MNITKSNRKLYLCFGNGISILCHMYILWKYIFYINDINLFIQYTVIGKTQELDKCVFSNSLAEVENYKFS